MLYCFDTSAFMDAWSRHYPPDVFPGLWTELDRLAANGGIIAPDEVLRELGKKDDELHGWSKARAAMFIAPDAAQQQLVRDTLSRFPRLVDTRKGRSGADPFVIALAKARSAVVVTGEKNEGTLDKPRIPTVCEALDVEYMNMLQFIRRNRWTFLSG